jgi:uncharacterized Zn-finger protein
MSQIAAENRRDEPTGRRIVHLPAGHHTTTCPQPADPVWDSHPKVSVSIGSGESFICPYCGTEYRLDGH